MRPIVLTGLFSLLVLLLLFAVSQAAPPCANGCCPLVKGTVTQAQVVTPAPVVAAVAAVERTAERIVKHRRHHRGRHRRGR